MDLDNTFSVDTDDSTGFLLWQVTNLWQRKIRSILEPYDLTHAQFVLMASMYWLSLQGQRVNQKSLSEHSKIDVMTTSTVLRTLQKKALIQRYESPQDSRAKEVVLTEQGIKLIQETVKVVEAFDRKFFTVLGIQHNQVFNQNLRQLLQSD